MKLQSKLLVLFVCVFLCLCKDYKVQAASNSHESQELPGPVVIVKDQLVITIDYGFSQEARYGRYVSFYVDIYNKGETFQGVVKATLLNCEQDNITYAKEGMIAGGEKTQVAIQLPMNRNTKEINFSLDSSDQKTIVEELIPLNIKNYGNSCMIGLLSDNPVTLSYLQYFGNKVIYLDKDNLSSDYLTYDMLDTIVVDNFDLDSLEADKIAGLLNFVEMGGNLVLGINEDCQSNIELLEQYNVVKTNHKLNYAGNSNQKAKINLYSDTEFTKMLTSIRDYENSRNSLLQEIEENKALIPNAGEGIFIGKSMLGSRSVTDLTQQKVPKQVTQFSLVNAENVIERDNVRVYEQVSYGSGNILVFHFSLQNTDITEDKLALYDGCGDALFSTFYAEVASQIQQSLSQATMKRLSKEQSSEGVDYRIQEIAEYSEIKNVPQVGWYIIILLLYIIILGPVSFLILWKLKKQSKLWIVVPSVSVIFFVIVYLAGTKTRIKAPYAGYLNIEYYDNSLSDVQGSTYAYVGLNEKSSNAINYNNADALMIGDDSYPSYYGGIYNEKPKECKFYDYTDDAMSAVYTDHKIKAQFFDRAAFNTELFRSVYHKPYQPLVESNLTLTKDSLKGTITNISNQTLYNALLYLCGYYVNLGNINPGDTVDLSDCISTYMENIDALLYGDNDIKKDWNIDIEKISKAQIRKIDAYAYAYEQYLYQSQEPCIIASVDRVALESPLYEIVKGEASYGDSIVISKMNLSESNTKESIVPNIDRYLKDRELYNWYENTRFAYANSIDFTYNVPKTDRITELYISDLFNNFNRDDFTSNNCGRIYLYNYSTQKYDLIFDLYSAYGTRSINGQELGNYIDSENRILVRYECGNTTTDGFLVPIISCRKETINADN